MSAVTATESRVSPWSGGGRNRLVLCVAVAGAAIGGAWFLAAGRNDPSDQLVFVSLALLGIACEVSGVSRFIGDGRRSIRSYRRELLGAVAATDRQAAPAGPASSDALVARPEGRWIHRADCPMVGSRQWEPVSARQEGGRRPCPACRP